jgi:TRAP-type C4-dicarboxylate transport system permease small subunit
VTRAQLLVLALSLLALVALGWIAWTGLWRRHRVALVGAGILLGLLALTRRLGWPELAILGGVVLAALLLVPARR